MIAHDRTRLIGRLTLSRSARELNLKTPLFAWFVCLIHILCYHGLSQEIPENLQGIELYDWIGHQAISDVEVSNDTLNSILEAGLNSEDRDIQSATLGALAWISVYKSMNLPEYDRFYVPRTVEQIPALKENLIQIWEQNRKQQPNPWIKVESDTTDSNKEAVFVEIRNGRTVWKAQWAWLTIPAVLVTFYPQDPAVYDIVWEAQHPQQPLLTLSLLDVGKFTSTKANEFRIKYLTNQRSPVQVQLQATLGLGRFQSPRGLAALISLIQRDDVADNVVAAALESIVTYPDALKLYEEQINGVLQRLDFVLPVDVQLEAPPGEITTYLMYFVTANQLEGEIEQLLQPNPR